MPSLKPAPPRPRGCGKGCANHLELDRRRRCARGPGRNSRKGRFAKIAGRHSQAAYIPLSKRMGPGQFDKAMVEGFKVPCNAALRVIARRLRSAPMSRMSALIASAKTFYQTDGLIPFFGVAGTAFDAGEMEPRCRSRRRRRRWLPFPSRSRDHASRRAGYDGDLVKFYHAGDGRTGTARVTVWTRYSD